ncbi:hypothetical protein HAX54_053436 [Datura stramonium]|uniref:Uncharacterized protein n=1 Tax=Datura stramonium TaxID=4076 RepID=A0ABS8T1E2_DATST|nr:hypothetical protein [Datura stramonium]
MASETTMKMPREKFDIQGDSVQQGLTAYKQLTILDAWTRCLGRAIGYEINACKVIEGLTTEYVDEYKELGFDNGILGTIVGKKLGTEEEEYKKIGHFRR